MINDIVEKLKLEKSNIFCLFTVWQTAVQFSNKLIVFLWGFLKFILKDGYFFIIKMFF
jgi:hypothetical protein